MRFAVHELFFPFGLPHTSVSQFASFISLRGRRIDCFTEKMTPYDGESAGRAAPYCGFDSTLVTSTMGFPPKGLTAPSA